MNPAQAGQVFGASFRRMFLRTLFPQTSNFLTIRKAEASQIFVGGSLVGSRLSVPGSACHTGEKLARCSRSNPLQHVSLRFEDPNLINLLQYSPGFAEWNLNSATEMVGSQSDHVSRRSRFCNHPSTLLSTLILLLLTLRQDKIFANPIAYIAPRNTEFVHYIERRRWCHSY